MTSEPGQPYLPGLAPTQAERTAPLKDTFQHKRYRCPSCTHGGLSVDWDSLWELYRCYSCGDIHQRVTNAARAALKAARTAVE